MNEIVTTAFRSVVDHLRSEIELMPLSRWTESVVRYYFCRSIAMVDPNIDQFVECGKIDLVLYRPPTRAFVEFKFYRHPRRFDPYDGKARGFKGGPGRKNLGEFRSCVDQLHERPYAQGLSKYIVLIYADPNDGTRPTLRFSQSYDAYEHPSNDVVLRVLDAPEPFATAEGIVQCKLYELAPPNQALHPTAAAVRVSVRG